jgi:hypothetical protein
MVNAPEGQVATAALISVVVALPTCIHGLSAGLNTEPKLLTQLPECLQSADCQITVISPFEYPLVILFLSIVLRLK